MDTWGDWSWADGAAWSFTNWAGSQPKRDDMGMGDENCVTINGYTGAGQWCFWSLISCQSKFSFQIFCLCFADFLPLFFKLIVI